MKSNYTVGWDIGGAHLKAVACDASGAVVGVWQQPCPLWQGLNRLRDAVLAIVGQLPDGECRHALTMTGELVDLFAGRDEGVAAIIGAMKELLPDQAVWMFAGSFGLLPLAQIDAGHYPAIASSNWLASAGFAAQQLGHGLFVDIGSTTTDILPFKHGEVIAQGYTDYQRLASQELVYTGIIRTAVMAVAQTAVDEGREVGVMAEYFATMADVYRLTGELDEAHDQTATADGAEKTVAASARRLARMIGCDFLPEELPRWRRLAENIRGQQLEKIKRACKLLSQQADLGEAALVGAGVGRFLVKRIAEEMGYPYRDFSDLGGKAMTSSALAIADCAPAAALAFWLGMEGNGD